MTSYSTGTKVDSTGTGIFDGDGLCIGVAYGGKHWLVGYEDEEAKEKPLFGPDPQGRPAEANARLWAHAGEVLAAAIDALESLRRLPDSEDAYRVTCIRQLEVAIAHATGEEAS